MIECKIDGHVAVITLNNPSANTFTAEGLLELSALIADLNRNLDVYAAVVTGQGEKFFSAGAEIYGGLGGLDGFGLKATSHYAGPTVAFNIPRGPTVSFSPSFGLNANSVGALYRFKVSYEFQQIFSHFHGRAK